MTLENLAAFVGISIPLITIAGTAVAYVFQIYVDAAQKRRKHFFELMALLDGNGTIASKLAAIAPNIEGANAKLIADEMERTIGFFKGQ